MLTIIVPGTEYWDETKEEFFTFDDVELELEHSLASLSKWESIYEKPFLSSSEKTIEEWFTYVQLMTVTPNIAPQIYNRLSEEAMQSINEYMSAKRTATWFSDSPNSPKSHDVITAELIYYWMFTFHIPLDWENRHLNQLFTLIKVCNAKQEKPKKMSRSEAASRQRELNAQRRQQLGTTG